MIFQRLRLSGFKSFVEAAELRIGPGLTGVVGPNGCGKSNLLEAFRWVMGEGSAKSLRSGAMDDVIFAGTAARPGRNFAEVALTLDAATGAAMQVVRRIERGLGSAYRIDGRDVRARDVALLFADSATGAHSPALVSQGRIGAIIAARPVERRQLLEEAAGIAGLHVRRHEAELRLSATEANLVRIDELVATHTGEATALRRAARTAERYRTLSAALDDAQRGELFAQWTAARAALAAATAALDAAEAEVAGAGEDVAAAAAAHTAAGAGLRDLRDAANRAEAALATLRDADAALAVEAAAVARRSGELDSMRAMIDRDRAREAAVAADAAAACERLDSEAAALETAIAAAAAALPGAQATVTAAAGVAAERDAASATTVAAHAAAVASVAAAEAVVAAATERRRRTLAEADRLTAVPPVDRVTLDARCSAAAAAASRAVERIAAATVAIDATDRHRAAAAADRDAAARALTVARTAAASLAAEAAAITRQLARQAGGPSLLDTITVAAGDEIAFAAAFGDDLNAALDDAGGTQAWAATAATGPSHPAGSEPLRARVPRELARRLAATGVAAATAAPGLAAGLLPGQRLVTRDGRMWRWDGFRTAAGAGAGAAAAALLTLRNRQSVVAWDLAAATAAVTAAAREADAAAALVMAAVAAERLARDDRAAAERDHDAARTANAVATTDRDQAIARSDAAAAAIARLRDEAAEFARDAAAALDRRAAAGDVARLAAAVGEARDAATTARTGAAGAHAAAAALVRDRDVAVARRAGVTGEQAAWTARLAASAAQTADLDGRAGAVGTEAAALAARPAMLAAAQADLAARRAASARAVKDSASELAVAEDRITALGATAAAATEALSLARETRASTAAGLAHAQERCREVEAAAGARFGASPPSLGIAVAGDPRLLAVEVARLTAAREAVGPVNLRADDDLVAVTAALATMTAERDELATAVARLRGSIGALNREGRARLLAAFAAVDGHFRDLFASLFAGGIARLEWVEGDDPLAAGLEIMAQPPGKKLRSLGLLSGGEQALTATALIFALFLATPAPLCVLDEVDGPLDDANVERFCDLLDRMAATTTTRFLVVTHNAVTMSRMHRLYGVTMAEPGVSQLVSVDLGGAAALLAAE